MRYIFLFIITAILWGCHKEDNKPYQPLQLCSDLTSNLDTVKLFIQNNWNWIETKQYDRRSFSSSYHTPKTDGYTMILKISGDTATFYKNNVFYYRYKFKVATENDIMPGINSDLVVFVFLDFDSGLISNYVPIYICQEYLVLDFSAISETIGPEIYKRIN